MSVHLTYSCPCGFISHRKDKLKDHCRSHEHKANPLHRECIICSNPVKSQQEYFQCIIEHCRLPEQYHSETGVLTSQVFYSHTRNGPYDGSWLWFQTSYWTLPVTYVLAKANIIS